MTINLAIPSVSITVATEVLKEAGTLVELLDAKAEVTGEWCSRIIEQVSRIKTVVRNLLREDLDSSMELKAELTSLQSKLFMKLPPFKFRVDDSEIPISMPSQTVDKMNTIKTMVLDLKTIDEITLPDITKKDLSNVSDFLNCSLSVNRQNWHRLCHVALFLDIPQLQAACGSFAEKKLSIADFIDMERRGLKLEPILGMLSQTHLTTLFHKYTDLAVKDRGEINTALFDTLACIQLSGPSSCAVFIELKKVGRLKNCQSLYIDKLSQEDFNRLEAYVADIEDLTVNGLNVISIPAGFTKLKKLRVDYTKLTDEGLKVFLEKNSPIEELRIEGSPNITSIPVTLPKLKRLTVFYGRLTDGGLKAFWEGKPPIEELSISDCEGITRIPVPLPKLKKLTVYNAGLTDKALEAFWEGKPPIEELDIVGCPVFTRIPVPLPKLKKLMLSNCKLTDEGLKVFWEGKPPIEEMEIRDCRAITQIPVPLPKLKKLMLEGCKLTDEGLEVFWEGKPPIEDLLILDSSAITQIPVTLRPRLKKLAVDSSQLADEELKTFWECETLSTRFAVLGIRSSVSILKYKRSIMKYKSLLTYFEERDFLKEELLEWKI